MDQVSVALHAKPKNKIEDTLNRSEKNQLHFGDKNMSLFEHSASRKNQQLKTEELLKDEIKRAEYMSTYHARPAEMDRKSGAVSKILESHESTHIFGNDNDVIDGDVIDETGKNDDSIDCPFASCGLHHNIVRSITSTKGNGPALKRPTVIQRNAWDQILIRKGRVGNNEIMKKNLFIQSETGSGKTLAYLIPIVQVRSLNHTLKMLY